MGIRDILGHLLEKVSSRFHGLGHRSKTDTPAAVHLLRGKVGEDLAYRYLRINGYRIVARNYRKTYGEIDLIGWDNNILAFVEVKLRSNSNYGLPQEAVKLTKRRQICRVAKEYRNRHRLHGINYRFDIVSIQGTPGQERVEILKDAFKDFPTV